MKIKVFFVGMAAIAAGVLSAASLNVEMEVRHGVGTKESAEVRSSRVAYFVLDRSGSMSEKTLGGGRTPNDALLESLRLRLDALPDGTSVFLIPFSSTVKEMRAYKALDSKLRSKILDSVAKDFPNGLTLLYDAQDIAMSEAARTIQQNPGAEVSVYVYTDGDHQTPYTYKGEYPACYQVRNKISRKFETNPDYEKEKSAAFARFKKKWSDFSSKPNLELEYEWLSRSAKPDTSNWGTKPRIATELDSRTTSLKNPRSAPVQNVQCRLFLPVTDGCWDEIKGCKTTLDFEVEGKRFSRAFDLKDGKSSFSIEWPSLPEDRPAVARIALSRMPAGKKFDLKPPKPIEFTVPPQGRVSVSIDSPAKDAVFPVGGVVRFSAKASDGASVRWTVGGETLQGSSVEWTAKTPGRVDFTATASMEGLKDAAAGGAFEVIPTGVEITASDVRHEVGGKSTFQAKAVGPCIGYLWTIDGKRVPGETANLDYVFDNSGTHQVGVTAIYKAGIVKDAKCLSITVSPAPFLEVVSPLSYDGDAENAQYQAEKPIDLLARVEGDLTSVSWQFKLKNKVTNVSTDVKGGKSSGRFVPAKGGYYDVAVTAEGPAGKKTVSVQMFVKSTEVRVDISSPSANQDVETGREFDLAAVVKGPVKNVRWKIENRATAKPVPFGASDVSAVIEGKTAIKAKLPLEIGNANLDITAEPVLEDADLAESVQPSTIEINASTHASVVYTPETLASNWKRVRFGSQTALAVTTEGAVTKVAWFACDADGNEKALGKEGATVNVDVPSLRGQSEFHVDYLAKGLMPDGSWKPADQRITIVACCPCAIADLGENAKIVLPMTNGIMRTSYGLKESVHAELMTHGYEMEDVIWGFGDTNLAKVVKTGAHHPGYDAYGKYRISAEGKCSTCGRRIRAQELEIVVEPQPINAEFTLSASGFVAQGRQITLKGMESPDIARRVWTCNGEALKDNEGKTDAGSAVEVRCSNVGEIEFGLVVYDEMGNAVGPVFHKIRVYRLWVVVLAALFAMFVTGYFWWYYSSDDPRFWKVCGLVDEVNGKDAASVEKEMLTFSSISRYWDTMWNRATIPLHRLGGSQSLDWGRGTAIGDTGLVLWESSTAADSGRAVRMPNCDLMNKPDGMEKETFSSGQLIHIYVPSPSNLQAVTALWVKIKMRRGTPNTYLWLRLGIAVICAIAAFVVAYCLAF